MFTNPTLIPFGPWACLVGWSIVGGVALFLFIWSNISPKWRKLK